jgi:hypothetical protein
MSERRGNASEGEMVHGGLVEEALRVWRDGERLLEELLPLSADHGTVRLNVVALRETYHTLTSRSRATSDQIAECADRIESARAIIRHVRGKFAPDRPESPG